MIKKSLCTWRLQYNHQVHRDSLITLYKSWRALLVTTNSQVLVHSGTNILDASTKNLTIFRTIYYGLDTLTNKWTQRNTILKITSNKMQQYAGIYLLQNHSTCFGCLSHPSSGVHKTVTAASGIGHNIWATTFLQRGQFGHVGGRLLLYQRLQLQFYVLLMMGAMDTQNM